MQNVTARAKLSIGNITVELEGPIDFVSNQFRDLRDILLSSNTSLPTSEIGKETIHGSAHADSSKATVKSDQEFQRYFGVNKNDLDRIVQFSDGRFFIIGSLRGQSAMDTLENHCLIHCFISEFFEKQTTTKELREISAHIGIKPNAFGTYLSRIARKGLLLLLGSPRSKDRPVRLTLKGREAAKTLIKNTLEYSAGDQP